MDKHCIYSNPNISAPCFPFVQLDEVEQKKERANKNPSLFEAEGFSSTSVDITAIRSPIWLLDDCFDHH